MRLRTASILPACLSVALVLAPGAARADWDLGHSEDPDRVGDNSTWGSVMCIATGVPATLAAFGFGVYDVVQGARGKMPNRTAMKVQVGLTVPHLVVCAIGMGLLAAPKSPLTAGDNWPGFVINGVLMAGPLVAAIHGIWALAKKWPADQPPAPPPVTVAPIAVGAGSGAGPGLAVIGRF